jgi:hemerythrin-like domain-containing protein
MMKTKPIKRNQHIMRLSKDHHFSLLFCWKVRQGLKHETQTERIIKYVQYFWKHHLEPHFREEETILFSPLKDEWVQKAINDHKQIRKQLNQLPANSVDDTKKQLKDLANLIDDHVRYEERELFPHLEKRLSEDQLEKIGKQLDEQQPSPLTDDFEDQFWMKQ